MRIISSADRKSVDRLATSDAARRPEVERQAARIIADVRRRGDKAVLDWTRKLDGAIPAVKPVPKAMLEAGWNETPADVRTAIKLAVKHLERVASRQVPKPFAVDVAPGLRIEQQVQPLARVGCYVPGGRYPLPSTLLMTVVPARVAGVPEIAVVCPRPAPVVLAAALEAGATELFTIGGAQAVAAFAYGTNAIRRVDKIVGPGNAWVTAAKALVSADCAIDLHAGPSEIVVASDDGNPDWIAADLIAQAEHDPAVRAVLVTTKKPLAREVAKRVKARMPRTGPAAAALAKNGALIVAKDAADAADIVNRLAPEHLVVDDGVDISVYRTAGTIFVGPWSAQASGDYCTGSNHVLPTGGAGRFRGGLSAADFVKVFNVQRLTEEGLRRIGPAVVTLAEAEGLAAHAESVRTRL